jgi:hypothetical protein
VSTTSAGTVPGAGQARQFLQRHFMRIFEQTARLADADLSAEAFYADFLQGAMAGTSACAGVVWGRAGNGPIRIEHQINLEQVGLNRSHPAHDELLRRSFRAPQPMLLGPHSGPSGADGDKDVGNPTDRVALVAPIVIEKEIVGLVEVWLDGPGEAEVQAAYLQFLVGMAHYASIAARNRQLRTMASQQDLWTRLETFCRQVHGSLDLTTTAFVTANDGRLLVGCDRLSVAGRRGRRTVLEAISGADTVDRRSSQVRLLAELCGRVLTWGEPLVYRGHTDDTLPPDVIKSLDAYLAATNSQFLVVRPLRQENAAARFALVLENFEPTDAAETQTARLEVVGRHALSALTNAATYRRIPFRWLWRPLGALGENLGEPRTTWTFALLILLAGLITTLVGLPCPLKMEATGQLLPRERRWIYAPAEGQVIRFEQGIQPGATVAENQSLVLLYDTQLELKLVQLSNQVAASQQEIAGLTSQQNAAKTEPERANFAAERKQKEFARDRTLAELKALKDRVHADDSRPGYFWLKAPLPGTVLSWDFRERLTNRFVKPSEPLLRIGDKAGGWEVELKISHKHLGQILEAFAAQSSDELEVDLLPVSMPTHSFKGKLTRSALAVEATPDPDSSDTEPVARASVRIDGPDIAAGDRLPHDLLVTGTEVHAKVRCGTCRAGYALFYGVWEFIYEKVLFW